jgi:hypothetical protein
MNEPITYQNFIQELLYLQENVLQDFKDNKLDMSAVVHCGKYYLTAYKDGRSEIRKIDSLMSYPDDN